MLVGSDVRESRLGFVRLCLYRGLGNKIIIGIKVLGDKLTRSATSLLDR